MILEHEQWCFGYDQILKDCSNPKTALLLCNADADALSSARILTYMLRSDGIRYQLMPCTCYTDLESILTKLQEGGAADEIGSLVLINFGASKNLTKLFERNLLTEGETKIYVMDCRRPVHLANVYSPSSVVMFMDSTQSLKDMPSDGDNLSGEDSSSSESDDSDDDDSENDSESDSENDDDANNEEEASFDDVVGETRAKQDKIEKSDPSYDAEDENEGNDDDDDDDENNHNTVNHNDDDGNQPERGSNDEKNNDNDDFGDLPDAKRQKTDRDLPQQGVSPRELHSLRGQRLSKYYSGGSYFGSPSSFVAYRLASQNRCRDRGDLLWLACVGVTDAYLHSRLDLIGYARLAKELGDAVHGLFPNDSFDRALNTVYAEDLAAAGGNATRGRRNSSRTKISLSENGRIVSEKDFRFFLLRHCSLLDSMMYSEYVCTRLQVYTRAGEQRLMEMLARMGYPLDECRQPFAFLRPSLRRRLKEKLGTHAQEYNLDRFEFTGFTRVTGYSSLLSASDTSYAITALLEHDGTVGGEITSGDSNDHDAAEREANVAAFYNAYDALGSSNSTPSSNNKSGGSEITGGSSSNSDLVNGGNLSGGGIGEGLRRAIVLQKSIFHTAVGLMERNAVTLLRHFRYAHVASSSSSSSMLGGSGKIVQLDLIGQSSGGRNRGARTNLFSKPLALTRLAHFLMDMNRENGKWSGTKARPLVMIADKPFTNTCLIVGYEQPQKAGDFVRNTFGKHFEMTARSMNGTFRFDSFDSNVVEVSANDVQRFMEQLHYLLDSM